MKKLLNILIVIVCMNWVIIGFYLIKQVDFSKITDIIASINTKDEQRSDDDQTIDTSVTHVDEIVMPDDTYLDGIGSGDVDEVMEESYLFTIQTLQDVYGEQLEQEVYLNPTVISYDELRYLEIPYYGFDSAIHMGEMIVNASIAEEVIAIFKDLLALKFPIEKMFVIQTYQNSDSLSMADNNSSAFNFREVTSGKKMSQHAYGLAIDLNPLINPYISNGIILPASGMHYANRNQEVIGMIKKGDPVYEAFVSRGWVWGGDWSSIKDYQHFERPLK